MRFDRRVVGLAALLFLNRIEGRAVEPPRLVLDSRTLPTRSEGSAPHAFATLGDVAIFAARGDDHADRLFRSDGTAAGTVELARPCAPLVDGWLSLWTVAAGRAYYFASCADTYGQELWSTDGTAEGTVRALGVGQIQLAPELAPGTGTVEEGGRLLFFQASYDGRPIELWSTDGSAAGSVRIAAVSCPSYGVASIARRGADDYVLLVRDDTGALTVWRSDGTEAGTVEVLVLPISEANAFVRAAATTSRGFVFVVGAYGAGDELWTTDGTVAGTGRIAIFDEISYESFAALGGSVYFTARLGTAAGIFRTDGFAESTRLVAELSSSFVLPRRLELDGTHLYFLVEDRSWAAAGLNRVPIDGGTPAFVAQVCSDGYCTELNSSLWFRLVAGRLVTVRKVGEELSVWTSAADGSDAARIAGLCAEPDCYSAGVRPESTSGGLLFVTSGVAGGERELWFTDGTSSGSGRLAGPLDAILWPWTPEEEGRGFFGATPTGWIFAAADDLHGLEPWHAAVGGEGAELLSDLYLDRPGAAAIRSIAFTGDEFLFSIWNGTESRTLYRREVGGSEVEPFLTVPILHGRYGSKNGEPSFHAAGNAWFFIESPPVDGYLDSRQVWRYDTVSGDTRALFADPRHDGIGATANELHERGGDAFLLGTTGPEMRPAIYKVRPLSGQTAKWLDVPATYLESLGRSGDAWFLFEDSQRLTVFDLATRERRVVGPLVDKAIVGFATLQDGALVLVHELDPVSSETRAVLWQSDGTDAGTSRIHAFPNSGECLPWIHLPRTGAEGPQLFAVENYCAGTVELWSTDGSARRTRPLVALEGSTLDLPEGGVSFRGERYFLAVRPGGGSGSDYELWRTDGTPEGTAVAAELPGDYGYLPYGYEMVSGSRGIYFAWATEAAGYELWRSDGTQQGTGPVADLLPGPGSSSPQRLHAVGDQVLFLADLPETGRELWQVDGESAEARLVVDLYPGAESSSAQILDASDEALYLFADDGVVGRELWEVVSPSAAACDPGVDLCLAGGRFRSRAVWRDFDGRAGAAEPVAMTADAGYFAFFDAANPELLAKVVDACSMAGFENFWTFTTGLTNLEVELEIVDTVSGERSRSSSRLGEEFAPKFDTGSFRVCGNGGGAAGGPAGNGSPSPPELRLALLAGRFEIAASWATAQQSGSGNAVALGDGAGYFWFFSPANVELFVKMADACGMPEFENHWLFAAGLTDVEVELQVSDTWSGEARTYRARRGRPFAPILDTNHFRTCGE
jgi:ELWxxDGT repeat protein